MAWEEEKKGDYTSYVGLDRKTVLRFSLRWIAGDAMSAIQANPVQETYHVTAGPARRRSLLEGHVTLTRHWIGFGGS